MVLFSRISRARPSRKFPLQFMSIYSNDNIRKIAKLTTRELPQKSKNAKITVRENNGLYSIQFSYSYRHLRARRALSIFKDVSLSTRRVQLLYNVYMYGDSAFLVLNRASLNSDSTLLTLNWWYVLVSDAFWMLLKNKNSQPSDYNRVWDIVSLEPESHCHYSKMFHWETERHYHCTRSMAIAPF